MEVVLLMVLKLVLAMVVLLVDVCHALMLLALRS